MSIFNILNSAIYTRLAAGTALTTALGGTAIYYQLAPDNAALPYVVWSYQAGPTEPNRTHHRDPEALIYIRAYADDAAEAGRLDAAIDAALRTTPPAVAGYSNRWFSRNESIAAPPNIDETQFKTYNAGAIWAIGLDKQ
jgi:hypothetical protein